jgi:hypothetical protein
MPKGQAPYKKKDAITAAGDRLRSKLSGLRGPIEEIGKKVQGSAPAISKKFPDKKAKGGMVKSKGRKC